MNDFDERYDIRLARYDEIEDCMQFINDYWKKNHIMAVDRKLFEYEYVVDGHVNMIIARDRKTGLIEAFFGFIQCSNTDPARRDIWGSMWMVNETHDNIPLLGIELAKRVYELTGCRMYIGNGANPETTVPIRRLYFRDKTGKMKQFYMLNDTKEEYEIAVINNRWMPSPIEADMDTSLKRYYSADELDKDFDISKEDSIPYKDNWYIRKRYFMHPYYEYQVYGIEKCSDVKAVIIMKEVNCNNSKVLRIVDYIGCHGELADAGALLYDMMYENGYEYIDFYEYGFDEDIIKKAGFRERQDNDINIIPNYFEPFLKKNIDIWVHYKHDGTLFFKADGDQDRPNVKNVDK